MGKPRKSPQEKKELELRKDHFTFAKQPHAFRKEWKRKKTGANRTFRRQADALLIQAKSGVAAEDAELVAGDITPTQIRQSITRTRLHKSGTVSLAEKIKIKSEKRKDTVGRRVNAHRRYDRIAFSAVEKLKSLDDAQLIEAIQRIAKLLHGGDPIEWQRVYESRSRLDRAIYFVERLNRSDAPYLDALRRNQELCHSFQQWQVKANRILKKLQRPTQRKLSEIIAVEMKIKGLRRKSE